MAQENIKHYPIWIKDDQLHFHKSRLRHHLLTVLNYSYDDALAMTQEISRLSGILDDFPWEAAKNMRTDTEVLLQSIEHDQLLYLLTYQEKILRGTALHHYFYNNRSNVIAMILDRVTEKECERILGVTDSMGWTSLHAICYGGSVESGRCLLQHKIINPEMKFCLLQKRDSIEDSPLHLAIWAGYSDMIEVIHESVTQTQWINLIMMKGYGGMNLVQRAAYCNEQDSIEKIKTFVSDEEWLQLVDAPLLDFENNHFYDKERFQRAVSILADLRVRAKIRSSMSSNDEAGIKSIVETESLTIVQIQELFNHSSQYIIPHSQEKCKRWGLVFFRSKDRQGAVDEANDLEQALVTSGCSVIKREWSEAAVLHSMIDCELSRIVGNCSMLIVCLMSHGSRGVIYGSNDISGEERIPVNDILHRFTSLLPNDLPMVMLIQACQGGNRASALNRAVPVGGSVVSDPAPTQLTDPHKDQHITLTRPHTVLLLATVRGGVAYRGVFTGAMADQFRSADGGTDIYAMFTRAATKVTLSSNQQAQFISTATKTLIIPPAIQ